MSVWKDEDDFMKDVESISEFYIPTDDPKKKLNYKSARVEEKRPHIPWYDSDSDEDITDYYGRGRPFTTQSKPGGETSHLDIMREIQMQVRSAVGNRYQNQVLESYYNVCADEDEASTSTREIPVRFPNVEPKGKKPTVAENIETATAKISQINVSQSAEASPKRNFRGNHSRGKNYRSRKYSNRSSSDTSRRSYNNAEFGSSSSSRNVDLTSSDDFPPL